MEQNYVAYNQENDCYLRSEEARWSVVKNIDKARVGNRKKLMSVITTHGMMLTGKWTLLPVRLDTKGCPVVICSVQEVKDCDATSEPSKDIEDKTQSVDCAIATGVWTCGESCIDIVNALDVFASVINPSRMEKLSCELSEADKELSDIYHYIEFNSLNASQGYKAYRLLQNVLIKRRNIKNEYSIIQSILSSKGLDLSKREIQHKLEGGISKSYNPRVLSELFSEGIGVK